MLTWFFFIPLSTKDDIAIITLITSQCRGSNVVCKRENAYLMISGLGPTEEINFFFCDNNGA